VIDYVAELKRRGSRCTGQNADMEADLLRLFPAIEPAVTLYDPCLVADTEGRIMFWFLPGIVSPKRKVSRYSVRLIATYLLGIYIYSYPCGMPWRS